MDALFSCAKDRKAFLGLCGDRLLFCAMAAAVLLFVLWPLLGIAAKSVNLGEGVSLAPMKIYSGKTAFSSATALLQACWQLFFLRFWELRWPSSL